MSLYSMFQNDANLERDGIVLEYGVNAAKLPISFRIARAGGSNEAYTKRMTHRMKPLRRQIQTETLDPETAKKVVMEVFVETVLLGWENVDDADGNPLPFTRDNALKLFNDLPDLYLDITEQAQKAALFRKEIQEADAGN